MDKPDKMLSFEKGVSFKNPALSAISYPTSTPPRINSNTHILAVCPVDKQHARHKTDGWFFADFFAFNLLFKGLGASQTWLARVSPRELLDSYGPYVHGNPFEDRKVVLSEEILEKNKLTPVTLFKGRGLHDYFLGCVARVTEEARRTRGSVLIIACCHGLEGYEFNFSNGKEKEVVSITRVQGVLERYVPVCLLSTACHSGGWSMSPDINISTMTAAREDQQSLSWPASDSISRCSGSVFVSAIIETMTAQTNDLEAQIGAVDQARVDEKMAALDNEDVAGFQTKTYMAFCRAVYDSCLRKHRLMHAHQFAFSCQDDEWGLPWQQSASIPLASYAQRWQELETYPYTGTAQRKLNMNPSASNPSFADQNSAQTGRLTIRVVDTDLPVRPSRKELFSGVGDLSISGPGSITADSHARRVAKLARAMQRTCPGDENNGYWEKLNAFYEKCAATGKSTFPPDPESAQNSDVDQWDLDSIVQYRLSMSALAVYAIVDYLNLPRPNNQTCLEWQKKSWQKNMVRDVQRNLFDESEVVSGTDRLADYMRKHRFFCMLPPTPEQGPPYLRFQEYILAAVFEARLESVQKENKIMDRVIEIIAAHHKYYERIAYGSNDVHKMRRLYLALSRLKR